MQARNLLNEKFGLLTVVEFAGQNAQKAYTWKCVCDCGKFKIATSGNLRSGNTRSCGCLNKTSHIKHGLHADRLHRIWNLMHQRCSDLSNRYYGGKGIIVCDEWKLFEPFREWSISNGYGPSLTIDRLNPQGNYCPQNCRWASAKDQNKNKSSNKWLLFRGQLKTLSQWSELYSMNPIRVNRRLMLGWSLEEALTTAIDQSRINKRYKNATS